MKRDTFFGIVTFAAFVASIGHDGMWVLPRAVEVLCLIMAGVGYFYFVGRPLFHVPESERPANPYVRCLTCGQTVPKGPRTKDEKDGLQAPTSHT